MLRIAVTIEGSTGLICNRFDDSVDESGTSRSTSGAAKDRGTPKEQADKKLYKGLDGKLIIPQPNLLRCIVDGGKFHKVGKSQITTQKSSILYACIDIEGTEIEIVSKEGWRVDTRAVRIPSTGGRILAHRPMFDDWALTFEMTVDTTLMNAKLLRQIVDDAGQRVGLGDFRPSCKGPYGKFKVTNWQELAVIAR